MALARVQGPLHVSFLELGDLRGSSGFRSRTEQNPGSMKLPFDAVISLEKLNDYLLTELPRGDKSRFLAEAGYTRANPEQLERDLREQILTLEGMPLPERGYGDRYEIRGVLRGPNGVALPIRTIWMREFATGTVKFITLIPFRREIP